MMLRRRRAQAVLRPVAAAPGVPFGCRSVRNFLLYRDVGLQGGQRARPAPHLACTPSGGEALLRGKRRFHPVLGLHGILACVRAQSWGLGRRAGGGGQIGDKCVDFICIGLH